MARSSKPLRIALIDPQMETWPEIQALRDKGHQVVYIGLDAYDLVLGSKCWRFFDKLRPYLALAIKEATKQRYGTKKGEEADE